MRFRSIEFSFMNFTVVPQHISLQLCLCIWMILLICHCLSIYCLSQSRAEVVFAILDTSQSTSHSVSSKLLTKRSPLGTCASLMRCSPSAPEWIQSSISDLLFFFFHPHIRLSPLQTKFFLRLLRFSALFLLLDAVSSFSLTPLRGKVSQQSISHRLYIIIALVERNWERRGKQERSKPLSFLLCSCQCFFLAMPSQPARTCQPSLPIIISALNFCWSVLVCWFPICCLSRLMKSSCNTCVNSFILTSPLTLLSWKQSQMYSCSGLETLHRTSKQCLLNRSSVSSKICRFSSGNTQLSSWVFSSIIYQLYWFLNPNLFVNSQHWRKVSLLISTFATTHRMSSAF